MARGMLISNYMTCSRVLFCLPIVTRLGLGTQGRGAPESFPCRDLLMFARSCSELLLLQGSAQICSEKICCFQLLPLQGSAQICSELLLGEVPHRSHSIVTELFTQSKHPSWKISKNLDHVLRNSWVVKLLLFNS